MKRTIRALVVLALAGAAAGADPERLAPAEPAARGAYDAAADTAEAAYLETAVGSLRVFLARIGDAERAIVREGEAFLTAANRIRKIADRFGPIADEAAKHINLGGVLPMPPEPEEELGIEDAIGECREEMSAAKKAYREALEAAAAAATAAMAPALDRAIRSGDLDAANRVKEPGAAIAKDVRFRSVDTLENRFLVEGLEHWRVVDGELIGTARKDEKLEVTAAPAVRSISAVTIRARIVPPSTTNLRLTVGPVNAIFNWERAPEAHFRYQEDRTIVRGNLLTPGTEHEITVRQLTRRSIEVLVDGRRVWITHGTLEGTVTVYPSESTIGIRQIRILGVASDDGWPDYPSHRRW